MTNEEKSLDQAVKLVIGCNYHTKWQSHRAMRFVLCEIRGDEAKLKTRTTNREFWTKITDLIFIDTKHNRNKAEILAKTI